MSMRKVVRWVVAYSLSASWWKTKSKISSLCIFACAQFSSSSLLFNRSTQSASFSSISLLSLSLNCKPRSCNSKKANKQQIKTTKLAKFAYFSTQNTQNLWAYCIQHTHTKSNSVVLFFLPSSCSHAYANSKFFFETGLRVANLKPKKKQNKSCSLLFVLLPSQRFVPLFLLFSFSYSFSRVVWF